MSSDSQRVYERFFSPGKMEVVEVRALGLRGRNQGWDGFVAGAGVCGGYFNDAQAFEQAAMALDEAKAAAVYFTLNPTSRDLLARAVNRLVASPKHLTQDSDIECLRWLPIDLDPIRPAGISSTDAELKRAADVARKVTEWLESELGFPKGLRACSGNGYHLCYRLPDLPNDTEHRELIKKGIAAVAVKFSNNEVDIDLKVGNPARIWKVYGTVSRKGDSTKERPHRRSYLFQDQPERLHDIEVVPVENLQELAALAPDQNESLHNHKPARKKTQNRKQKTDLGPLDIERYLDHYGVEYNRKSGPGGVTMYRLEACLFDTNHTRNEASINQASDGMITYQCFHNSCRERTWSEARKIISGDDNLAEFCEGYDPNWKSSPRKPVDVETGGDDGSGNAGYLVKNERGRVQLVQAKMANYLEKQFKPFFFEGYDFSGQFQKYHRSGVWKPFSKDSIRLVVRNLLGDFAKSSWIDGVIDVLSAQTFRPPDELEFDPMWLNVQNGMLHVETMELVPHSPSFYSRVQLPVTYREDAACSRWIEVLLEIFKDDPKKGNVLQEFFGYCLYPKILFPAALFQIGQGRNGKGVIERVLCTMLGKENVSHISLGRLEDKFGPAELRNKLLNSTGETESKPLDVTTFKAAVAGDEIQAEVKYKPDVKFRPIAKHMVSMNAFPGLKEKTDAFFRRIIVLEYNQKFEGDKEDKRLADRLIEELDGVFKWSLEGLKRVLKNEEICTPEAVIRAKRRFQEKINPVLSFVNESCVLSEDTTNDAPRILPAKMYEGYQAWMDDAKLRALGKQNFYEQIYLNYPSVRRRRYGSREYFFGIGLRVKE